MRQDEFWDLIGILGGTAGGESVARLAEALAQLPTATVEGFDTELEARVEVLTESPAMPEELRYSDVGESFAAAIVAAGNEAYEKALKSRHPLDADEWSFEEAEDLLVVTETILEPAEIELDAEVEWLGSVFPEDVETPDDPVACEFDDLGPEWGVRVADDPQLDGACADIARAPSWRSWFGAQPRRPGAVVVAIEDDASAGLVPDGRPQAPHYRYVVPAQRLLDASDRRAEMRRVLVDAWCAVADSVGWERPPEDPGRR